MKIYIFVVALLITGFMSAPTVATATGLGVPVELDGYAWSATMGWISMNCDQSARGGLDLCGTSNYRVQVETGGNLTGYAWSSNAGWIRFGGLSGFPTGDGVTNANATAIGTYPNLNLTGWARACAGAVDPTTCSGGLNVNAGGWDGWIALAGTGYNVTFSNRLAENSATSFAWGGPNTMGWIDFSPEINGVVTPVSLATVVLPDIVINSIVANAPGAFDVNGVYDSVTFQADVAGIPLNQTVSYNLSLGASTPPQAGTVNQTASALVFDPALSLNNVPFAGGDLLRLEVDMTPLPHGAVTPELDETNVFETPLVLSLPAPTITITGPEFVRSGGTATIGWEISAPYRVTCTVAGPGINESVEVVANTVTGSQTSSQLQNAARFVVTCIVGPDTYTETFSVEVIPSFQEI